MHHFRGVECYQALNYSEYSWPKVPELFCFFPSWLEIGDQKKQIHVRDVEYVYYFGLQSDVIKRLSYGKSSKLKFSWKEQRGGCCGGKGSVVLYDVYIGL